MNAITRIGKCTVSFAYEDAYGNRFGTWHDIAHKGRGTSHLVGYAYSSWFNREELIDAIVLSGRPSIGMIKEFIRNCKKIMED